MSMQFKMQEIYIRPNSQLDDKGRRDREADKQTIISYYTFSLMTCASAVSTYCRHYSMEVSRLFYDQLEEGEGCTSRLQTNPRERYGLL